MAIQNFVFEKVQFIEGLQVITPFVAEDDRGLFRKTFEHNIFKEHGIDIECSELEESISAKGVVRGLHMQHTAPQHKLVRVINGAVFDVAVDARRNSPTFGKYYSVILSAENKKMFYIPAGFFHGFLSLSDNTIFSYLCCGDYNKAYDGGIRWNDKDIGIEWPLDKVDEVILSDKDRNAISFKEYCDKFTW